MKIHPFIIAFAAAVFALASCVKDPAQDSGSPSITIDGKKAVELSFGKEAGTREVTIVSNREWKVKDLADKDKSWITVSGATGTQEATSGKTVTIGVSENTEGTRTGEVIFTIGTSSVALTVSQRSGMAPKTLPYEWSFRDSLGRDFEIENKVLPDGYRYIWSYDASYKCAKGSCGASGVYYDGEANLVSPVLAITGESFLTFSFKQIFGIPKLYPEQFYVEIRSDAGVDKINLKNPKVDDTKSPYIDEMHDLSEYAGQNIQIAFVYKSSTAGASTVDLVDFRVAAKPAPITTDRIADILAADKFTPFTLTGVTVAETGKVNCVVTDNTDYLLLYDSLGIVATRNDIVTVKGETTIHADKVQGVKLEIKPTGSREFVPPVPEDITSTFDTFKSDRIKYVKVLGTIEKSTTTSGTYYNIIVPGAAVNKGSLADTTKQDVSSLVGKMVEVEGFYINTTGTVYVNILPSAIREKDYIIVDPASKTVLATDTSVSFDVKSNVTWSIDLPEGFTSDESLTGVTGNKKVTVKFAANTDTENSKKTELVVKDDASAVENVVFTLIQNKASSGEQTEIVVDFTSAATYPDGFPSSSATGKKDAATYTFAGNTFTLAGGSESDSKYYRANSKEPHYLLFGKTGAYIEFPLVEGKALASVKILTGTSVSLKVSVGITDADGKLVSGTMIPKEKGEELTFLCAETDAAKAYRVTLQNGNNFQIRKLTLIYE